MLSVVIPIYNAEKIILDNYKVLRNQLENIKQDYEIIFEDDASCDRSRNILEDIAQRDHKVKIFSHHPNQGLGFTLRQLFKNANGDIIIYLDIDLPFGTDKLPLLLKEIETADVVLASRYSTPNGGIPIIRKMASKLYYLLCKTLFDISVKDLGSAFVIFKRKVLNNIDLCSKGFDIHIELFAKLKKSGFSVKEIPIKYTNSGYTTFSILKHGPGILINTLKFWIKNR